MRFAPGVHFDVELVAESEAGDVRRIGLEAELLLGELDETGGGGLREAAVGAQTHVKRERHAGQAVLLHLFDRYGRGGAEHGEVVEDPPKVDEKRGHLRVGRHDGLADPDQKARDVERHQNEDGLGDAPVDVFLVDRHALGGDVELPLVREDERDGRREENVPGEHRFVDGAEEGIAVAALQDLIGERGVHHVRNDVGEDGRRRSVDHVDVREHVGQGRAEKDEARQPVQEVEHGVEEAEPLRKAQPLAEEGIVEAEDLNHSARPADALPDVRRKRFRREARGDGLRDEGGLPSEAVELERRVRVFRYGFYGDAADLHEGRAAHDGARAAEHHGVPGVVALLNEVVKERILDRHRALEVQVLLKGIGRIEVMRRLHERDVAVLDEPAHRRGEEVA